MGDAIHGKAGSSRGASATGAGRSNAWEEAIRVLAARAVSTRQLQQHLARRGYGTEEIGEVVARLTAARYLDDAEYARAWARARAHRRWWGPGRVAQELKSRGIDQTDIRSALEEAYADQDARATAEAAARRKLKELGGLAPEVARRRLAAFLTRRGFAVDIVFGVCRRHFPTLPPGEAE